MTTSPIRGQPPLNLQKQIRHRGSRGLCDHLFKILSKSVKGFLGYEGQTWGSSIDFNSRQHYRATCNVRYNV